MMKSIIEAAQRYPFNSFGFVDNSELREAVMVHRSDQCILLSKTEESRVHLHWACDSDFELKKALQSFINDNPHESIYLEFIPENFLPVLESVGFHQHSEYIDYWLQDLQPVKKVNGKRDVEIRRATAGDFEAISSITHQCKNQSRGFTVETQESVTQWHNGENNYILVAVSCGQVLGHALLSRYGFDSEKGVILWIREIAVRPESQRQGFAKSLLISVINWGCMKGAVRSFLACDSENYAAIRLYEQYGYIPSNGRGQINMIYTGNGSVRQASI